MDGWSLSSTLGLVAAGARPSGTTALLEDIAVPVDRQLTNVLGAHSVVEAVGTQESFMQAVGATRGGWHLGYVGANYDVTFPGIELFLAGIHTLGGPAPVRRVPARPDPAYLGRSWHPCM
ncbi:hypothetical protein ACH4HG_16295 [Streptomyces coeruleorubidus]|uniref:hypothetical protein n=1 Tax=Streptomyces coeruleorubidus TaxID=116188 RepID=UPI0037889555